MTDLETDPELAELRARRIRELTHGQAVAATPSPPVGGPVELTTSAVPAFLAAHPHAVIDVWAPWCGPCRTMAPVLDRLSRTLGHDVRFGKVNADTEPSWPTRWNVTGIPTLLLFDHGRLVDRVVGAQPEATLRARLDAVFHLPGPAPPGV
ncbi:MAG TPA: thioredoxin domain-containing protein [Thermoplasmata archaeon]|nr:thioredoxin domain-containing protein [Thermoplasmata archaeon]